jgi:hypothetical protein
MVSWWDTKTRTKHLLLEIPSATDIHQKLAAICFSKSTAYVLGKLLWLSRSLVSGGSLTCPKQIRRGQQLPYHSFNTAEGGGWEWNPCDFAAYSGHMTLNSIILTCLPHRAGLDSSKCLLHWWPFFHRLMPDSRSSAFSKQLDWWWCHKEPSSDWILSEVQLDRLWFHEEVAPDWILWHHLHITPNMNW